MELTLLPRQSSLHSQLTCQTLSVAARDPGNLGASSSLLFKFASQEDLSQWNVFSDKQHGGKSEAELRLADDEPVSCLCCTQGTTAMLAKADLGSLAGLVLKLLM